MECPATEVVGESKAGVIDVLRAGLPAWRAAVPSPTPAQEKAMSSLQLCRTAALGGHVHKCSSCTYSKPQYNSCRNRHCPNCQSMDQARWVEAREEVLLPVGHHHVVFTLPSQLRTLAMCHPTIVFSILFEAVREALTLTIREHMDGESGITAVLHTWTRNLLFHPHIHCIVAAGAWTMMGWTHRTKWLVPAAHLKAVFRGRILAGLEKHRAELGLVEDRVWWKLMKSLPKAKKWVVYLKAPMSEVAAVVKYLGQYTHRVAISDWRILAFQHGKVTFTGTNDEEVELSAAEFTGRFMQHVLPKGFRKIRHYGLYAPGNKSKLREEVRTALLSEPVIAAAVRRKDRWRAQDEAWTDLLLRLTGVDAMKCPRCGDRLIRVPIPRGPP